MFTYNVGRKWFTKQEDANKYRVSQGLKPNALIVVRVDDREALAALLNALCEPPQVGQEKPPATTQLVNNAYVDLDKSIPDCVPQFLRKDWSVS